MNDIIVITIVTNEWRRNSKYKWIQNMREQKKQNQCVMSPNADRKVRFEMEYEK